ncbi:MAG: nucleotidyltransferase domain-containing protein [Deltaproteobacteria bacterium]|nr:nucleotidyltransferase domain-containing protein [Deltaproteobacteria bacterium]
MAMKWEITSEKIQKVISKIVEVSNPRKLILFGSYVRGNQHINSDLDILVVAGDEIDNPRKEGIRIRRALKGINMPMDILVVPENKLEELMTIPGLIYKEAINKGKVVYESAR